MQKQEFRRVIEITKDEYESLSYCIEQDGPSSLGKDSRVFKEYLLPCDVDKEHSGGFLICDVSNKNPKYYLFYNIYVYNFN